MNQEQLEELVSSKFALERLVQILDQLIEVGTLIAYQDSEERQEAEILFAQGWRLFVMSWPGEQEIPVFRHESGEEVYRLDDYSARSYRNLGRVENILYLLTEEEIQNKRKKREVEFLTAGDVDSL